MCLGIALQRPDAVLGTGIHAGFEWQVIHNTMGYRCGYVKVLPGHPWHGKPYDDIECEVHGGLTFASKDVPCDKGGPDSGYWVGFDCAHAGDADDLTLPADPSVRAIRARHPIPGDVVRTQEYVEAECRSLCEQAARAVA